jgi:hypothetical protein
MVRYGAHVSAKSVTVNAEPDGVHVAQDHFPGASGEEVNVENFAACGIGDDLAQPGGVALDERPRRSGG